MPSLRAWGTPTGHPSERRPAPDRRRLGAAFGTRLLHSGRRLGAICRGRGRRRLARRRFGSCGRCRLCRRGQRLECCTQAGNGSTKAWAQGRVNAAAASFAANAAPMLPALAAQCAPALKMLASMAGGGGGLASATESKDTAKLSAASAVCLLSDGAAEPSLDPATDPALDPGLDPACELGFEPAWREGQGVVRTQQGGRRHRETAPMAALHVPKHARRAEGQRAPARASAIADARTPASAAAVTASCSASEASLTSAVPPLGALGVPDRVPGTPLASGRLPVPSAPPAASADGAAAAALSAGPSAWVAATAAMSSAFGAGAAASSGSSPASSATAGEVSVARRVSGGSALTILKPAKGGEHRDARRSSSSLRTLSQALAQL